MSNPAPETPETRAAEAEAIRRRWITLGEVIAVLAVSISGLTLYLNWAERRDERAQKAAESSQASARVAMLVLSATALGDDHMGLKPTDPAQIVQSQTILFPTALGLLPVQTTGDPRIEAKWFADALEKARDKARLPDDSVGDERLPVAITTRFVVGANAYEAVALYDIGYGISGRLLVGHDVRLRGLSRVSALKAATAKAAVDARWAQVSKS